MKSIVQQIDWAEVGQIVLQGLITLAVLAYVAGELVGRWLHRANDQLARFWVQLVVPDEFAQLGEVAKPQSRRGLRLRLQEVAQMRHPTETQASTEVSPSTHSRPAPAAPMQHPLAEVASQLQQLTAVELRSLLGTRQRCSKAQLVAAACCW